MNRPDFSEFVVHFTKDAKPIVADAAAAAVAAQTASQRLVGSSNFGTLFPEILAQSFPA